MTRFSASIVDKRKKSRRVLFNNRESITVTCHGTVDFVTKQSKLSTVPNDATIVVMDTSTNRNFNDFLHLVLAQAATFLLFSYNPHSFFSFI